MFFGTYYSEDLDKYRKVRFYNGLALGVMAQDMGDTKFFFPGCLKHDGPR